MLLPSTRLIAQARFLPVRSLVLPGARPFKRIPASLLRTQPRQWLHSTPRKLADGNKQGRYFFPETIDVFLSQTVKTAAAGVLRVVVTAGSGVAICFGIAAPFLENSTWWLSPTLIVGAVTFFTTFFAFSAPYVTGIGIRLPTYARASKDHLKRFAANVPPNTPVVLKYLSFYPKVQTRHVQFRDLRRIVPEQQLVNLEHIPRTTVNQLQDGGLKAWVARRYWGRFLVDISGDRSRVPGIIETLWPQIPPLGSDGSLKAPPAKPERGSAAMNNRAPSADTQRVAPLPPRSRSKRK